MASAGDNTGQNTKDIEPIPIPDPTGNRIRTAGLEGKDSTDHATVTDFSGFLNLKIAKELL